MKRQLMTKIGLMIFVVSTLAMFQPFAKLAASVKSKQNSSRIVKAKNRIPNQYIVVLKDEVSQWDLESKANEIAEMFAGQTRFYYKHALKGFSVRLSEKAAIALSRHPLVDFIEEDEEVAPSDTQSNPPNWGLDRIDQRNLPLNGLYSYSRTGEGVNAYVIDTGIYFSRSEFNGRAFPLGDVVNDGTPFASDCNGHGTNVAGILGGTTYGVAKRVNLFSVRIGDCGGFASKGEIIAGMEIVQANHVKPAVANLSYNAGCNGTGYDCSQINAVDVAAKNLIASGVTLVTSAGNHEDYVWTSPARVWEAITVGAVMQGDRRVPGTAFGGSIDVFAPGWENLTLSIRGGAELFSNTSAASPHVAGAVALFLQANPGATPAQAHQHIVNSATTGKVTNIPKNSSTPNRLLYIEP